MQPSLRYIVAVSLREVIDHGDVVALIQQQPDCV
jgi:hypothetical protein